MYGKSEKGGGSGTKRPIVAYLRVSTGKQGKSGLGIEAQREAIARFTEAEGLVVASEHVEVETGKGADALDLRPQLRLALDSARKLKCPLINLWPGQDGYDYIFQSDYRAERRWTIEAVKTAATAYPDIRFSLEYKPKEPRTHSTWARAADTLLVARETGLPNVGVTIDTGHSLSGGENMAEAAVILSDYGRKLFHLHFNDNYRSWDDDMIVGSVHFAEFVELLFWLREVGYDGWYSMDQYPYREDGQAAIRSSVEFLRGLETMLDGSMDELRGIIASGDPIKYTAWIRSKLFRHK